MTAWKALSKSLSTELPLAIRYARCLLKAIHLQYRPFQAIIIIALAFAWALPPLALAGDCEIPTDLSIRVGPPRVIRGPANGELDTRFPIIKTANDSFRGFSSNQKIYRLEGLSPWDMSGNRTLAMDSPPRTKDGDCGYWLNDVKKTGTARYIGLIHTEKGCSYQRPARTHKSTRLATSIDEGVSWKIESEILTGTDSQLPLLERRITGEGDCTSIDGQDGFLYAYCLRALDQRTIVARASLDNLLPGTWKKFYAGGWTEPGIGGQAAALGKLGTGSAYWADRGIVILVGIDKKFGGVKLSLSCDKTTFVSLDAPLVPLDDNAWTRPAHTELYAYPGLVNPVDGGNTVSSSFLLEYVYLQPGDDFTRRHQILREITIRPGQKSAGNRIGIALAEWSDPAGQTSWATTGPVLGKGSKNLGVLGYLLTKDTPGAVRLDECAAKDRPRPDTTILVTREKGCGDSKKIRTAGWVYKDSRPGTVPLHSCSQPPAKDPFVSTKPDCGGRGTAEKLLGHALAPNLN